MFGKPGSISICVYDLPAGVSVKDLKLFVRGSIDSGWSRTMRISPAISDCIIVRLTNPDSGHVSHQGLVAVQPARLALELIDKLQQIPLRGTPVSVCRYRHSSSEIDLSSETRSIGDLVGFTGTAPSIDTPHCTLDLVAHTGEPTTPQTEQAVPPVGSPKTQHLGKTTATPTKTREAEQQPATDSAFAH